MNEKTDKDESDDDLREMCDRSSSDSDMMIILILRLKRKSIFELEKDAKEDTI